MANEDNHNHGKEVSNIVDIYEGEYIQAWKDDELLQLSFFVCGVTLTIPLEVISELAKELTEFALAAKK